MSLQKLVSLADDIPWCGNVPHPHPPRFFPGGIKEPVGPRFDAFVPHPEPWILNDWVVRGSLADSIRMMQLGQQIQGETGRAVMAAAQSFFDDRCGTIPLADLLRIILQGPPPPPEPWMERMSYLANTIVFAQQGNQEQQAVAASKELTASLKAIQKKA